MSKRLTQDLRAASKLIEQELGRWELTRRRRTARAPTHEPEVQDFICISRMVGVDGHRVASAVGESLGWPVFGREILEAMAGDDAIRHRIYADMDERDMNWFEESLRTVLDRGFGLNDYFRRLCETVLSLARQGSGVFVGRGADLILPRDVGLRVRLVAPVSSRVSGHAATTGLDPKKAREDLERVEHQREEFFQHRFGIEASDPLRHDLIINLDRWTPEDVVALVRDSHARRGHGSESQGRAVR